MPRRRRRSEPRWSLAEPPPGLFPAGEDILRLLAVLAIAAAVAAACSLLNRSPSPFCDSDSQHAAYGDWFPSSLLEFKIPCLFKFAEAIRSYCRKRIRR